MTLGELLALWRETRAPEVAELIDQLAPRLGRPLFPKTATFEEKQKRWLVALRDEAAFMTVLDALHDGHSRDVAARVEKLDALPPDPRLASALVRAFEQPTHLNVSTLFLWEALSRAVVRRAEPRSLARLDRVSALGAGWVGLFRPHLRPLIGAVLERTRVGLTRALAKKAWRPLSDAERATLGAAAPRPGKAEALAAVWAQPDDLAPRLVFSDMLTAEGDPRGEFIALQCAESLSVAQRRRVASLLKAHRAAWAAPLGRVCSVDAFERGFPAVVTLTARSRLAFGPLLGHPAWNTVHTIAVGPYLEPLLHPAMTRVRCVRDVSSSDLRSLGKHAAPFPFTTIVCRFAEAIAAFQVLRRRELFPRLVEVRVEQQRALDAREAAQLAKLREARPEVKVRFGRR